MSDMQLLYGHALHGAWGPWQTCSDMLGGGVGPLLDSTAVQSMHALNTRNKKPSLSACSTSSWPPYPGCAAQASQQGCVDHSHTSVNVGVVNLGHALLVRAGDEVLLDVPDVSEILDVSVVCARLMVVRRWCNEDMALQKKKRHGWCTPQTPTAM